MVVLGCMDDENFIYDVGILEKVGVPEISCSTDGIELLELSKVDGARDWVANFMMEQICVTYYVLPVEINTKVATDNMWSVIMNHNTKI